MSSLLIPASGGPTNPTQSIVVDTDEGQVNLDLSRVTEPDYRHITLTPEEARALACALLHYAAEATR